MPCFCLPGFLISAALTHLPFLADVSRTWPGLHFTGFMDWLFPSEPPELPPELPPEPPPSPAAIAVPNDRQTARQTAGSAAADLVMDMAISFFGFLLGMT